MTIKPQILVGDIFKSDAQTLVNTVNCVGVMGKGLALEFKKRFPDMYQDYVEQCKLGKVKLGKPYIFKRLIKPWILLFPTKDHWRSVSKLSDIEEGLNYLEKHYKNWGIVSLAVPPLGCGLGELNWEIVGPTLYRHLKKLEIPVQLYAPHGTPKGQLEPEFLEQPSDSQLIEQKNTPKNRIESGFISIIEVLNRIENNRYRWPIGRTMLNKLAYFATTSGLNTGLDFKRGSFGPFAPNLKSKLTKLVNNGLVKEDKKGSMFIVKVGDTYPDARKIQNYRKEIESKQETINKLADLFSRIQNTTQAEIAATVHFAYLELKEKKSQKPSEDEILNEVMEWKKRRRVPLDKEDVTNTIRNLAILDWLDIRPGKMSEEEMKSESQLN
ncbi:MAG TPA: macro domain-containing protein [Thermodesulfobacteriota bacterium]|nr:macro domain-containing protein [Thermodesulfobacteriota bacterium]